MQLNSEVRILLCSLFFCHNCNKLMLYLNVTSFADLVPLQTAFFVIIYFNFNGNLVILFSNLKYRTLSINPYPHIGKWIVIILQMHKRYVWIFCLIISEGQ